MEIRKTEEFSNWIDGLKNLQARARIQARIERLAMGNPGDVKAIGNGLSEMRVDFGPGYRVYYTTKGKVLIILLVGGDKKTQGKDIIKAKSLAAHL